MNENEFYELTNPQQNIWNMEKFFEGTTINNICSSAIVYEAINQQLLEQAINNVVKNNDNFRIQVVLKTGIPMQHIVNYEPFNLEFISVKSEAELSALETAETSYHFNVLNSYLFRFRIAILEDKLFSIILTTNHLIADSWTLGLVIKDILKEYHALKNNIVLDPEKFSYIDYINSEKEYKNSKKYEIDRDYWSTMFKTVPEYATIPSTKKALPDSTFEAKRESFLLDTDFVQKINDFCKANKISTFNFLLSVYAVYISKVSNVNDFAIGTPILNRSNFREKQTMGMFVNTVPVKISMVKDIPFVDFLHMSATNIMNVLKHQKYSYNQILEDLRKINPNISNLYNVLISYQITKAFDEEYGKYRTNWLFNNYCSSDFNIHISDLNDTGGLLISYDYLISKYELSDINNLHFRIINMIDQILNNNNIYIKDIEIVTEKEKNKVLYEFNNTLLEYPKNKTILDLFEEQVDKNPESIAVAFENQQLTYKQLNEKANGLAFYLRNNLRINRNDLVGIMVNRSIEIMVCIIGILKAGGAYVPIDPNYPKDRIDYMLKSSNVKALLIQESLKDLISFKNTVYIDLKNSELYSCNQKNLRHINSPDDLAYIIFTSGSTGLPKGVMIKHSNAINLKFAIEKFLGFSEKNSLASLATISFDMFVLESLVSSLIGLKIVIASNDEQTNIKLFKEMCIKNNVDILQTTPSRMQSFVLSTNDLDFIKNAKYILIGGESFPSGLLDRIKDFTNARIFNMYGPTETTVWSSGKELFSNSDITIGRPLANTQFYILDSNLKPMPIGVMGEIYISGDGVGKGYLENAELTSKCFIENPFVPGAIMYKTGDLGLYTETGEIICQGRIDHQVKIRGLRVELGEIENKINKLEYINSCAVVKKTTKNSHEILCAYFTANTVIDSNEIRNYLQKVLPKYMIPQYFTQMDNLPYTTTGKIDRKSLPDPQFRDINKQIILPQNNVDFILTELIKSLLKIDSISMEDSFFDIGGDSLSAINLCAEIQNKFNVQLFVRDILEHPQIKDLSSLISNNGTTNKNTTIKPASKADFYPVSSAQKRMYFSSSIAGNNSILYNTPGGVILDGNIDANKLEICINMLVERHETLRTYFELINENIVQKISNRIHFKLQTIENVDFSNLESLFKDFVKPFNLSQAPLFRLKLVKFTNGKSSLFLDMHHIISDGASINIFVEELCKLYNGETLPKLDITYKDFAVYENEKIKSDDFAEAENYWLDQFKDELPALNFPTSHPRPAIRSFDGQKVYSLIDAELFKNIEKVSKELNVTPYMIMLSTYYILLAKYTSTEDIIIGTPIVGRNLPQTSNLIGMFVNTLAIRNIVDNTLSFKEFTLALKEKLLDSYKYQYYPFDELVNKLNIKRDTSRNPLFDTMFIYQNNGYKKIEFNGINATNYIPDLKISKFDLSLEAIQESNHVQLSFEYATKLFDKEFVENLSKHYVNILKNSIENVNSKISNIPIISKAEEHQILYEFNNTKANFSQNKNLVEIFEGQAERNPENVALIFEDSTLTYKELNEKSNSFSAYLKSIGITNNDTISILLKRSKNLIITILGIIKSGASYVLIDTSFPEERVNYIISDSSSKYCIVSDATSNLIKNSHVINIDNFEFSKYSIQNPKVNRGDNLCIIYTSGSTGKPKGVILNKSGFVNLIFAFDKEMEISKYKNILGIATVSFDMFAVELFSSILLGNTLVLANEEEQKNIIALSKLIKEKNIEFLVTTPSRIELLLLKECQNPLQNVKAFQLGGEKVNSNLYETLRTFTNAKIFNGYGPTEITACCTNKLLTSSDITIGKPISNVQAYICDENMKLLPIGIIGEICIAGVGVSLGYLNNKEATSKNFIKNPFGDGFLYKTGDLGKFRANGEIEYIGRRDNQIKIRGLRIEIEEIESLILKYPNITKVAIIKQTINNRDFISAYFVSTKKIVINELRKYLSSQLPRYMVPSYFIALDDFPYTPSGKIDKKNLPLSKKIFNINEIEYIEPKTDLQKKLVSIWEDILNTKPIGIKDNFFELGGDSLLAMTLNIELLKISNKVTYQDIFRFPTIAELEEKINSNDETLMFQKIENLSDKLVDVLQNSTNPKAKTKKYHPTGILLTGSTGFLGIHILERFIKHEKCNIYCIIREEPGITARTKLYQKLNYYFGNKYDELIDKRIFAISGNICEIGFGLNQKDLLDLANSISVVINSAANVSHYGKYNDFYNTNVKSVKYMIDFCTSFKKKFYQVSTTSVSGNKVDSSYPYSNKSRAVIFNESCLYVGQTLDNVYLHSKFEAETYVLEAISKGLDGYILRMGNLMPRYKDGVFQENISSNAFITRIAAFLRLGAIPDYLLSQDIEFTPVDCAAKAIYKIITNYNTKNRIFHLYNHNFITIKKLLKFVNKNILVLDKNEFKKQINLIMENDDSENLLKDFVNNLDNDLHLDYKNDIIIKSSFTVKYLKKHFFKWPKIGNKYLTRFINLLRMVM